MPDGDGNTEDASTTALAELTDKQEAALRAAYNAGFFDRPQQATAGDVADQLDVSRSTLLYHLRQAERKIVQHLFDKL